ncbi:MAG: hypothetical protein Q7S09_03120 [bacterium]|nr:hypothetical protein [bacterium]
MLQNVLCLIAVFAYVVAVWKILKWRLPALRTHELIWKEELAASLREDRFIRFATFRDRLLSSAFTLSLLIAALLISLSTTRLILLLDTSWVAPDVLAVVAILAGFGSLFYFIGALLYYAIRSEPPQ